EVTAALLTQWKLPPEIVEPIRHHHNPENLAGSAPNVRRRAELLYFAGLLASLDTVVRHPPVLAYVMEVAKTRYQMPKPELVRFLKGITPKIAEFGELINRDVRDCPNFAEALAAGGQELVNLAVMTNRTLMGGEFAVAGLSRVFATQPPPARQPDTRSDDWGSRRTPPAVPVPGARLSGPSHALPEFRPAFLEEFPPGGCRLGDYELREVLGRGAMGVVYKAFEPSLARFVAVKMLASGGAADPKTVERFVREARACAAIRHENVITVYAVREAAGVAYIAMEYVQGTPLDRYIEQKSPLPFQTVAWFGQQLALGLAAAHKKGIVHRDIKPANAILENESGTVKIADFGLARCDDDAGLSRSNGMVGTPHYMSPEQVQGQPATAASDLFSLGGVLYTLLTNTTPFAGKSLAAVLYAVCSADPAPLRDRRPDVPQWMADLVSKLLDKNPARRFASAADVAAALGEHLA
ncbi:MAG: protein kinase, partial [Gemmataceae bacterium]|nr:protein kinase [Gemmataceae bacterium]